MAPPQVRATPPSLPCSRTFDWQETKFYITISDATTVAIAINVTGGARTRLECNASSVHKQLWVDRTTNGVPQVIAQGLPTGALNVVCANSVNLSPASKPTHQQQRACDSQPAGTRVRVEFDRRLAFMHCYVAELPGTRAVMSTRRGPAR